MEKILIKNSTIYDGTGAHPFQSDILIQNGKILSIGNLKELSATYVIDGSGLALSPGFIDTHTHSDSVSDSVCVREYYYEYIIIHCTM